MLIELFVAFSCSFSVSAFDLSKALFLYNFLRLQEGGNMLEGKKFVPRFSGLVYVIILCSFFKAIAYWILTPYLPMYLGESMGLNVEQSGYLIGLGSLTGTLMSVFCGFLVDRYNKKKVYITSLAIMSLIYLLFPCNSGVVVTFVLLILVNIASSTLSIVSNAWFSILLSEEESTKAFSIKYILENIGAMIGPAAGTILISYDLRFPFFFASISLFFTVIIFIVCNRKYCISEIKTKTNGNEETSAKDIRRTFSLLFADKRLLFFTAGGIFSMMIYGALVTFMSLYLSKTLPYEIAYQEVAYISALNAAIVLGLQYFISSIITKEKIMVWIRGAIIIMILGLSILIINTNIFFFTIAIIFLSFGEIIIVPAEYLFIIKITPEDKRGLYLGAQNLIYLGLSLSPILCGFILERMLPQFMFFALCLILLISLLFYQIGYNKSQNL